jgi:hypothetical protein
MDESSKVYVGLDVHKETIAIARALPGREPARLMGEIAHDVGRLVKKLQALGALGQVHVVYEASPTGYGVQRKLRALVGNLELRGAGQPDRLHRVLSGRTGLRCQS